MELSLTDWLAAEVARAFAAGACPGLLFPPGEDRTMAALRSITDEVLFVGGPKDGEVLAIDPTRDRIVVPEKEWRPFAGELHHYRRVRFTSGPELFVSDSLTERDVISHLLAGYRDAARYRDRTRHQFERRALLDTRGRDWQQEQEDIDRDNRFLSAMRAKPTQAALPAPVSAGHDAQACPDCDGKAVIGSLHGTTPCTCACHSS